MGEGSKGDHKLVESMAELRMKSQALITDRGMMDREAEKRVVVGHIRWCLSVAVQNKCYSPSE